MFVFRMPIFEIRMPFFIFRMPQLQFPNTFFLEIQMIQLVMRHVENTMISQHNCVFLLLSSNWIVAQCIAVTTGREGTYTLTFWKVEQRGDRWDSWHGPTIFEGPIPFGRDQDDPLVKNIVILNRVNGSSTTITTNTIKSNMSVMDKK